MCCQLHMDGNLGSAVLVTMQKMCGHKPSWVKCKPAVLLSRAIYEDVATAAGLLDAGDRREQVSKEQRDCFRQLSSRSRCGVCCCGNNPKTRFCSWCLDLP